MRVVSLARYFWFWANRCAETKKKTQHKPRILQFSEFNASWRGTTDDDNNKNMLICCFALISKIISRSLPRSLTFALTRDGNFNILVSHKIKGKFALFLWSRRSTFTCEPYLVEVLCFCGVWITSPSGTPETHEQKKVYVVGNDLNCPRTDFIIVLKHNRNGRLKGVIVDVPSKEINAFHFSSIHTEPWRRWLLWDGCVLI